MWVMLSPRREGDERCILPSWNADEWLDGIGRAVAGV
jgi:hypothetical protein